MSRIVGGRRTPNVPRCGLGSKWTTGERSSENREIGVTEGKPGVCGTERKESRSRSQVVAAVTTLTSRNGNAPTEEG